MAKKRRIVLGPPIRHYIKEWRKFKDMSQEEVGAKLGVDASHISQIERGEINYTRETLEALAYALGVGPDDLLGKDPYAPQSQLLRLLEGLKPDQVPQVLKVVKALTDQAA